MTTAYLRVILSMEILISYAPYRHQRYSSTNSLKRTAVCMAKERVCFPYEFTLLSNLRNPVEINDMVCFPYEFTLLSNRFVLLACPLGFVSPTNLHCSQTASMTYYNFHPFVSPTNLHCSQTVFFIFILQSLFVSPTNLHCSQTRETSTRQRFSLFPLRIYTALKPQIVQE